MTIARTLRTLSAVAAATGFLAVTGCGAEVGPRATPDQTPTGQRSEVTGTRIAVSYDGGVLVLDRDTLKPVADLKRPGFLRLNPAGDQRHLLVSDGDGFSVLDTGVEVKAHGDHSHYFAGQARFDAVRYPAPEPGHVVRHAGKVALFSDAAGTVRMLKPQEITMTPAADPVWTAPSPHHGVAVPTEEGGMLVSVGTEDGRSGAAVLDKAMKQVAKSDDCPDLHGEATTANGTILAGCTDGALLFKDGAFVKVDSPDPYGRIGTQAGSPESDVVLGDYKTDPDAELEEPTRVSLIDTDSEKLRLVDLGASYSSRSLGRGPDAEALVLGNDGRLHVIDPESGKITQRIKVTDPWQEPTAWQRPRPTLLVEDDTAWVTDPANSTVHVVYLPAGKVVDTVELPQIPNEISGVGAPTA